LGISSTTGGSLTGVTVNVTDSSSKAPTGSVALKVIVSLPFHSDDKGVTVAILETIETDKLVFPEKDHLICASE